MGLSGGRGGTCESEGRWGCQVGEGWYSGVYSGGLWGLEHPPVLPDNHETNLAISSVLV